MTTRQKFVLYTFFHLGEPQLVEGGICGLTAVSSSLFAYENMHFSLTFPLNSHFLWKRRKMRATVKLAHNNKCLLCFSDSYNHYMLTGSTQLSTSGPMPERNI